MQQNNVVMLAANHNNVRCLVFASSPPVCWFLPCNVFKTTCEERSAPNNLQTHALSHPLTRLWLFLRASHIAGRVQGWEQGSIHSALASQQALVSRTEDENRRVKAGPRRPTLQACLPIHCQRLPRMGLIPSARGWLFCFQIHL